VNKDSVPPSALEPDYLTPAEVAALLRVRSTKTVFRLAARDATLPVLRLGSTVRFPRARLLQWLRDREQGRPRSKKLTLSPANQAPGNGFAHA